MYVNVYLVNDCIVSAGVCDSKAEAKEEKKQWEQKSGAHSCVVHRATHNGKTQSASPTRRFLEEYAL